MLSSSTIANVALLGHLACLTTCFLHRPFIALSLESPVLGVNFLFMQLWMWFHHRASRRSWPLLVAFVGIQSAFWWSTVYIDSVLQKGWIYGVHWNAPEFEMGMVAGVPASVLLGSAPLGYASLILTDIITFGAATRTPSHRSSFLQLPLLALLDATLFTAYDLCVDPISTAAKLYFWQDAIDHPELTYFGVPVQNYVGWMLTMGAFFFVYRTIEHFVPPSPVLQANNDRGLFIWAPVLAFIWNLAWLVAQAQSNALRLVMITAMGVPALMAASRIFARVEVGEQEGGRKGVWDGEVKYENSRDGKAKNL